MEHAFNHDLHREINNAAMMIIENAFLASLAQHIGFRQHVAQQLLDCECDAERELLMTTFFNINQQIRQILAVRFVGMEHQL